MKKRLMEKRIIEFENTVGMKIDELDRRYYERKEFYDKYLEYRVYFKPEKVGVGMWKSICYNCGKEFVVRQYNWKQVSKICPECKEEGQTCIICGCKIPFGKYLCSDCRAKYIQLLPSVRKGYEVQGKKIMGANNPAKRDDIRRKISDGVKRSYEKNPELAKEKFQKFLFKKRGEEIGMSKLESLVASILVRNNIPYKYESMVKFDDGVVMYPDFVVGKKERVAIEVAGWMVNTEEGRQRYYKKIENYLKKFEKVIVVTYSCAVPFFSERFDNRVVVVGIDEFIDENMIEIGVDDVTNIDYGHWLSFHESKCHRYHWHTSWNVSIYVKGYLMPGQDILIDYGDLKKILKEVVNEIDHKILVHESNIESEDGEYYEISYDTDCMRRMFWPKREIVVVNFEPTAENIAEYLANKVLDRLPENIVQVKLCFREGTNNVVIVEVSRKCYGGVDILERIINFWYLVCEYGEYKCFE